MKIIILALLLTISCGAYAQTTTATPTLAYQDGNSNDDASLAGYVADMPGHHHSHIFVNSFNRHYNNTQMRHINFFSYMGYGLVVGGTAVLFDGVIQSASSDPQERATSSHDILIGGAGIGTGALCLYVGSKIEARNPGKYSLNKHPQLDSICYTKDGYPRFSLAANNSAVGLGLNFK